VWVRLKSTDINGEITVRRLAGLVQYILWTEKVRNVMLAKSGKFLKSGYPATLVVIVAITERLYPQNKNASATRRKDN